MGHAKLKYRPLEPRDMDSFQELVQHREMPNTPEQRRVLIEHVAFKNPMAGDAPTYFVAVDPDDRVCGYLGTMPTKYVVQGEVVETVTPHDLFVHPELRATGLAFFICAKLYRLVEAQTKQVFPLVWASQPNRELQKTRSYVETSGARRMWRIIRADSQLYRLRDKLPGFARAPLEKAIVFAADQALHVFDKGTRVIRGRGLRTFQVERFDERFDDLAERVVPSAAIQPYKPASLLNWRYIDRPSNRKTCFAVERGDQVVGWVVVGERTVGKGTFVDFLAHPEDKEAIAALVMQSLQHFARTGASMVEALVTDPRFARVFRHFLFFEGRDREYLLIGGVGEREGPARAYVTNPDNWHLTDGDTDGFLFSW